MIGRIVVHTVYVITIIMCYFIVSCIPVFNLIIIIDTNNLLQCNQSHVIVLIYRISSILFSRSEN